MKQTKAKTGIKISFSKEYESSSDFKQKFMRVIASGSIPEQPSQLLKATYIDTPLGAMAAIGDDKGLYLLEFVEWIGLERAVERLKERTKAAIVLGTTKITDNAKTELKQYFDGTLKKFKTPLVYFGTDFQKRVWNELKKIPIGETRSYADIARIMGHASAFRAVAQANAVNQFAVIVPCHRVINANGGLGGYGGGLERKQWLLDHESQMK